MRAAWKQPHARAAGYEASTARLRRNGSSSDGAARLDLGSATGYFSQKHRWPVPISSEGVCPRAVTGLLLKGENK
jgi:hypothetical protein